ncbi:MAG TPA: V-type ATP synthase subunit E [Bacilli bacterium]|nr:MAG: V-type proton ATPase subunit E [Tenericutes bacterium ADurb.BinA124]HNZ50607.1 V-type ATP synthase subunit E [Bacilli bacterium]HPN60777.1 V-type ATP synthase subunit E [Bacilli bacterium]HPX84438.1 V-type ATP synthase subunit E [Bacilli bacterium]HQC74385.1 V-type ATP synthase subunit E [Bacilli bacterium]
MTKLGNSSIYQKIEAKGSLDAEKIIKAGEAKAQAMRDEILAVATKEIETMLEKAKQRGQDLVKMKLTEQEQTTRQRTLARKKALIDEVFDQVLANLLALKDEDLVKQTVGLINQETIAGNEIMMVSASDYDRYRRLFASKTATDNLCLLDKLNKALAHPQAQLKLSSVPANIKGGFILSGKAFDIDLSFETNIKTLKESYEIEIAEILFGGE